MKYTKESLAKINARFLGTHYTLTDSDVQMANKYVDLIESTRSETTPKAGDILVLTNKYGEYYPKAHIEHVGDCYGGNVCENAYVPFVSMHRDGIRCSTSGGSWLTVDPSEMKYVGEMPKKFCDWGHCGGCADGAIEFVAMVSVWEWKSPECGEYTTKDYNKYHVSDSGEDSDYTIQTGYRFHVSKNGMMSHKAFKTETDYKAWLATYRGVEVDDTVWAYREIERHVSPDQFEDLDLPEDTMLFNGNIMRCKRDYDDENHMVYTYFVWYWEEDTDEHYSDRYMRQNKIREEKYVLDYFTHKPYELARREMIV